MELWWHGALKVFCCCVSYCFLSSLLACCLLYLRDQPLLWVAGHTTATGVGPECQSRQSVGGIVGVIDHWETDVQSCPCADTNTNPKKLANWTVSWWVLSSTLSDFIKAAFHCFAIYKTCTQEINVGEPNINNEKNLVCVITWIYFFPLYKIKVANHLQYTHIQKPMSLLNLLYFQVTAKWDDPWVPPNPTHLDVNF